MINAIPCLVISAPLLGILYNMYLAGMGLADYVALCVIKNLSKWVDEWVLLFQLYIFLKNCKGLIGIGVVALYMQHKQKEIQNIELPLPLCVYT